MSKTIFCQVVVLILVSHFAHATNPRSGPQGGEFSLELSSRSVSQESSTRRHEVPAKRRLNSGQSEGTLSEIFGPSTAPRTQRSFNGTTDSNGDDGDTLHIQMTAIHVDKSEFPLGKLLFKLTLRLALSEAAARLQSAAMLRKQPGRRVKLSLSTRSANTCSRQYAGALAAEEFYVKNSRLFIVSGCDDAIRAVSRLASRWRVPMMTAAGFGADLNDKTVHKTLIRVAFSLRAAVEFLLKVMKSFQWRRVNLVVDESDSNSLALKGSIEQYAKTGEFQVTLNTISFDLQSLLLGANKEIDDKRLRNETESKNNNDDEGADDKWPNEITKTVIEDTLWQCSMFSRVTILLIPQQYVRRFMLSAYDQKMANGLYTFINMPLLLLTTGSDEEVGESQLAAGAGISSGQASAAASPAASAGKSNTGQQQQRQQSFTTSSGENAFIWRSLRSRTRNTHAKQAFESLMSIYLRTPTTKAYVYFASKLNNLANTYDHAATSTTVAPTDGGGSNTTKLLTKTNLALVSNKRRRKGKIQLDINPYSASFYDSLQIYAWALNESLSMPSDDGNSTNLHARIGDLVRNRRFDNMVTGNIYINQNGDRETDYTLDDMNQMTGKFAPVILYRGETRDIERLGRIHWSSDASVGPTSDTVDCSLIGTCVTKPMTRFTFLLILLAGPLVVILSGAFYFVHNKLTLESQLVDHWWKIHLSELELVPTRRKKANDGSLVMTTIDGGGGADSSVLSGSQGKSSRMLGTTKNQLGVMSSRRSGSGSFIGVGGISRCDKTEVTKATDTSAGWASSALDACYGDITLAIYKLAKVALKPISRFHQSRKLMIELRSLKEINHNNLCRFVGILVDEGSLALVSEFCPKGSLREFFHNESMVIDWTFKYSIINDIIAGLQYLHSSPLTYHGRLKSSNCLVSARFVVKLSDYGPHSLYEQLDEEAAEAQGGNGEQQGKTDGWLQGRLWLAPEHLKSSSRTPGSMKGDVYSLGLLLYEIITNNLPFFDGAKNEYLMPVPELLQEIRSKGPAELMAPMVGAIELAADGQPDIGPLVELMQSCWRFEASKRPSSQVVSAALKRVTRGVTSKKLLENLTSRMEQYTNNLESLVEAKLATLMEEKFKTEELLYQFVPKSIASQLKEGQFVEPEAFECVTVFYSDIVGFTSLSSESSPMEVVNFLSDLYLCFDGTLEQHDTFKVDTIGDAYIVASGLPQRNDGKHVIEIACAALELRDRLRRFKIPHKPDYNLEMRVGIHSGPCIAGIVGGLNMPKYCVFGDTLTTGKFMESSGLPMKIHITDESRQLLQGAAGFSIEPRVPRITRDGLPFQTYWLERDTD